MNNLSLRFRLLLIAILAAALSAIIAFFFANNKSDGINWSFVIAAFLFSVFTSALIFIFLNQIAVRKIFDLFNVVKGFRQQDKSFEQKLYSGNEIDNLRLEILAWADDRKNEVERLKKLEVYRKEFLGNVSHELKTPIFNIQGYVLTLLDGGLEDPTINRDYLQRAERSIDRMITIIDDLEAISQLETGELQVEPERFDIVALVKDVLDAQELKATARGIILTLNDETRQIFVYADRFRIRQVIVNLIVNSVKYGKDYGETRVRFYDVGDNIQIEVSDNGIGIHREHLPRLFERFYRVDKSRSREMGGTGLGLAITKHILEAHNQTIKVMSTEGVGTVFTFNLRKG
jgi:two-component system phosphate regulon sensor histidine kinase PhoR